MPAPRNLNQEIAGITAVMPQVTGNYVDLQSRYNPQLTQLNTANFAGALRGGFDPGAFDAANPGFLNEFNTYQQQGELGGWTPEQYALAKVGNNQGALSGFYRGGAADLMQEGWQRANPGLTSYTAGLSGELSRLNGAGPARYDATGYDAYTAGPAPTANWSAAQASLGRAGNARFTGANGGPMLASLENDALAGISRLSPLESGLERQALGLLGAGGGLTAGETANVQDATRAAYADRGLLRSNRGVGSEILATDQAQRQRLMENTQFAGGISSMLEQQRNARRNYALGVQGQGQALSQFNSGQQNQLSQFNAGQRNDMSRFNAGMQTQNSQFNAGLGADMSRYNAGLLSSTNQFNAGAHNQAAQYNVGAVNDANRFNAQAGMQDRNDQWNRNMQYGQFQLSQAQNPLALTSQLMGNTPDYTGGLLSYGSDLYNTNYNAAAAAELAKRNNRSSLLGSALGLVGTVGGAFLGGPAGAAIGGSLLGGLAGGS